MATKEELRAKHGTIRIALTQAGELIFRKPTRQEWKKYKIQLAGTPAELASATENLMLDTVVSHTREDLLNLLEQFPAIDNADAVTQALRELSGVVISDEGKT
jgi:hypothetical protein